MEDQPAIQAVYDKDAKLRDNQVPLRLTLFTSSGTPIDITNIGFLEKLPADLGVAKTVLRVDASATGLEWASETVNIPATYTVDTEDRPIDIGETWWGAIAILERRILDLDSRITLLENAPE